MSVVSKSPKSLSSSSSPGAKDMSGGRDDSLSGSLLSDCAFRTKQSKTRKKHEKSLQECQTPWLGEMRWSLAVAINAMFCLGACIFTLTGVFLPGSEGGYDGESLGESPLI